MADNGLERLRQRVHDRIIGDFNEFIDDDAIRELMDDAVKKAFFEKRVESDGYRKTEKEPVIVEMARDQAMAVVKKQLERWMADNKDEVERIIQSTLEARFGEMVLKSFNQIFEYQMLQFQQSLVDRLQNLGR